MKNIISMLVLGIMLGACSGHKNTFTINGKLTGEYSGKVYLYKRESGARIKLDSAVVANGSFVFNGKIEFPELYYISLEDNNVSASFFAEPAEISFSASPEDFQHAVITGSASQTEFEKYKADMKGFDDRMDKAIEQIKLARSEGNAENEQKWGDEYDKADLEIKQFLLDNARKKNTSAVAAYGILNNIYYFDETDLEPVVNNFDPVIHSSVYVKQLAGRVAILKKVAVGQPAVDFTMADMNGKPVSLSSLYGKYLLVDFWASWCGPCRRENPNVVGVYKDFKDKGFDILGVSFDKEKEKWLEAVEADNLTWNHVGDQKGWDNAAGKLYAVNSIPANVLLDPNGIIIAKNLRGDDLRKKLDEVFLK
ncbi:MAG: AhpC/TSA family protein [Bacteroidetes bacterium]|nr:AhpC/TSA family protein [Bacteroidota bacterium]